MREVSAIPGQEIFLGRCGENLSSCVTFDVSEWQRVYGDGTVQMIHQRNGDKTPYPCVIEQDGSAVVWRITSSDVAVAGRGRVELQYYKDDTLVKSETFTTATERALSPAGDTPPEPYESWMDTMLGVASDAQESAGAAAESATEAERSATEAAQYAAGSAQSAAEATASKESAALHDANAKAWAVGGSVGEETDKGVFYTMVDGAQYYSELAKMYADGGAKPEGVEPADGIRHDGAANLAQKAAAYAHGGSYKTYNMYGNLNTVTVAKGAAQYAADAAASAASAVSSASTAETAQAAAEMARDAAQAATANTATKDLANVSDADFLAKAESAGVGGSGAAGESGVFMAKYGVTPLSEIIEAYRSRKPVFCNYSSHMYSLTMCENTQAAFAYVDNYHIYYVGVLNDDFSQNEWYEAEGNYKPQPDDIGAADTALSNVSDEDFLAKANAAGVGGGEGGGGDEFVRKDGDTMTGDLTLNPANNGRSVVKKNATADGDWGLQLQDYGADGSFMGLTISAANQKLEFKKKAAGATEYSYPKIYSTDNPPAPEDVNALPIWGGTMTGALTLSGHPYEDNHAATKAYVDDAVAGAGGVFIAEYGVTTNAEIYEAVLAGKVVVAHQLSAGLHYVAQLVDCDATLSSFAYSDGSNGLYHTTLWYVDGSDWTSDSTTANKHGSTHAPGDRDPIQVVTKGTYTGTGKYGSSNKNSLTAPANAQVCFIRCDTAGDEIFGMITKGQTSAQVVYYHPDNSTLLFNALTVSWSSTTLSWYNTTNARRQANTSGVVYSYAFI